MSKKTVNLMSVNLNKIDVSDKFNYNVDGYKYLLVTKKVKLLNHYVLFYLK